MLLVRHVPLCVSMARWFERLLGIWKNTSSVVGCVHSCVYLKELLLYLTYLIMQYLINELKLKPCENSQRSMKV